MAEAVMEAQEAGGEEPTGGAAQTARRDGTEGRREDNGAMGDVDIGKMAPGMRTATVPAAAGVKDVCCDRAT
eukprot:4818352-Prymnesium_polylepis.1